MNYIVDFLLIIFEQVLVHLPLCYGAYITFSLMKIPDLSIETAYLFGALFASYGISMLQHWPVVVIFLASLFLSMIGGMLVGITSSCITYFGKLSHLLSSIITFGIFHGIFQLLSASSYISLSSYQNSLILFPLVAKRPELPILFLLSFVVILFFVFLLQTQLGHCFAIFGQNAAFFSQFRISGAYVFVVGVSLANMLSGISGYLFAQTNNLIDSNMGLGKSIFCIMVIILGKSIVKKRVHAAIPICGIISYFFLQQTLLKIGFNLKYFTALQAIIILFIFIFLYKREDRKMGDLGI